MDQTPSLTIIPVRSASSSTSMRNSAIVTTFNATADLLTEARGQDAAAISVVSHISPERSVTDLSRKNSAWSRLFVIGLTGYLTGKLEGYEK